MLPSATSVLTAKTAMYLSAAPGALLGTGLGIAAGQGIGELALPGMVGAAGAGPGGVQDAMSDAGQPISPELKSILDARSAGLAHSGELLGAGAGAIGGNLLGQRANSILNLRNRPAQPALSY
jgi:hypothetical protein